MRGNNMKILVVDMRVPQPELNAGDWIIDAYIRVVADMGHSVTYWPDDLVTKEPYITRLRSAGISVVAEKSFEQWLARNYGFDVVMLCRPMARDYLAPVRRHTKARVLYFAHDLHFVREQREADFGLRKTDDLYWRKLDELYCMLHSDATIVLSRAEYGIVKDMFPHLDCRWWPWIQPVNEPVRYRMGSADLTFLGGFGHPPNRDAAQWLVDDIVPLILQELPNAYLNIVGSGSEQLEGLESEYVSILGHVADLGPVFRQSSVFVCPLRWGAGFKGKIALAMSYGLPVVTTSIGAEGMQIQKVALIAGNDAEAFADRVVDVCKNKWLWKNLSTNSRTMVEQRWSPEMATKAVRQTIDN